MIKVGRGILLILLVITGCKGFDKYTFERIGTHDSGIWQQDDLKTEDGSLQNDSGNNNAQKRDSAIVENINEENESNNLDEVEQPSECTNEGALRCDSKGGALRQRCESGVWVPAEPCGTGEVCDIANTEQPGTCANSTELCQGSSGESICQGSVMHQCGDNAVSIKQEECLSERHCRIGLPRGICAVCLPGEYRCDENRLEKCTDDGNSFILEDTCETVDLCNASAGACTDKKCVKDSYKCVGVQLLRCDEAQNDFVDFEQCDSTDLCDAQGKQCDICIPGEVHCEGDSQVVTCNSTGQEYDYHTCAGMMPYCTATGKCVGCIENSHCSTLDSECRVGVCENSSCKTDITEGAVCGLFNSSVCDNSGACVECRDSDDCSTNDLCCNDDTYCILNKNTCVECYRDAHCGIEHCSNFQCVPCTENLHCDLGQECKVNSCIDIVEPCSNDSQCPDEHICYNGTCATNCFWQDANCPPVQGWTSTCVTVTCQVNCSGPTRTVCPNGLYCRTVEDHEIDDGDPNTSDISYVDVCVRY